MVGIGYVGILSGDLSHGVVESFARDYRYQHYGKYSRAVSSQFKVKAVFKLHQKDGYGKEYYHRRENGGEIVQCVPSVVQVGDKVVHAFLIHHYRQPAEAG